jgi:hypothetical protein
LFEMSSSFFLLSRSLQSSGQRGCLSSKREMCIIFLLDFLRRCWSHWECATPSTGNHRLVVLIWQKMSSSELERNASPPDTKCVCVCVLGFWKWHWIIISDAYFVLIRSCLFLSRTRWKCL